MVSVWAIDNDIDYQLNYDGFFRDVVKADFFFAVLALTLLALTVSW